jgi:thioredoxin-dependent peroxiredoxin
MVILKVGDKAPFFEGVNEKSEKITLGDFAGKKLILFFYPQDNTPGCTAQACSLRDSYAELREKGFAVLGVSADSVKKHIGFREKYTLPFSLIADTERPMLNLYGVWGPKKFMGKEYEGIHRVTFVINEEGVIERIFDKVTTSSHADQILETY